MLVYVFNMYVCNPFGILYFVKIINFIEAIWLCCSVLYSYTAPILFLSDSDAGFGFCLETDKDTKEDDLSEVTFKPKLCMFEDDIMKVMGIKEDRKWPKVYYY